MIGRFRIWIQAVISCLCEVARLPTDRHSEERGSSIPQRDLGKAKSHSDTQKNVTL
jgi:hypothetical protein